MDLSASVLFERVISEKRQESYTGWMDDRIGRMRSRRGAWLAACVVITWNISGCVNPGPGEPADGIDEVFVGPDGKTDFGDVEEGSVQACGVLHVVNESSFDILDNSPPEGVGLDSRAAMNLIMFRAGADGVLITDDDLEIESLAQLDEVPYVGPVAFRKLLEFAQLNGFVDACMEVEPEGPWQFFVYGDTRTNPGVTAEIARSMAALDPDAAMCINGGDVTAWATTDEWNAHHQALVDGAPDFTVPEDPFGIPRQSLFRTDVSRFGNYIRYFGVFGNHDDGSEGWFDRWNAYLPGQRTMGPNSPDGIYFHFTYGNALFIVLDSVNPSDEQTLWLETILSGTEAAEATWVFTFFHHPVYPCNDKRPFARGLEWVTLFERYEVDVAFVAHSHTYERTCPMIGGACADGGVLFLNSSAGGAPGRYIDESRDDAVSYGGRMDKFNCNNILERGRGRWNHFCHFSVEDCLMTVSCFPDNWWETGEPPFDEFVIDRC